MSDYRWVTRRVWIVPVLAVVVIAVRAVAIRYVLSHVVVSAAVVSGVAVLMIAKHLGAVAVLGPLYARLRRRR